MSLFPGSKPPTDAPATLGKKLQFYVEFLGWMECRGLRGQHLTDPVIRELRRRRQLMEAPPKLTIKVSKKDLKISQEVEEKKKKAIRKIKFPTIPARDVTFVHQASQSGRPDDIVACIYLGYMPRTQRHCHVHVYRFDESSTASLFTAQLAQLIHDNQQHILQAEISLVNKGEIDDPRLLAPALGQEDQAAEKDNRKQNSASSVGDSGSSDGDLVDIDRREVEPDMESLYEVRPFDDVTEELKFRFQSRDAPILLPPKDYDTIRRAHGNLEKVNNRRCMNLHVVGGNQQEEDSDSDKEIGTDPIASLPDKTDQDKTKASKQVNLIPSKPQGGLISPHLSPQQIHKKLPTQDIKQSKEIINEPKKTPEQEAPNIKRPLGFPDFAPRNAQGILPVNASAEISPQTEYIYPPKTDISPKSPKIFHQPTKGVTSQPNSGGSSLQQTTKPLIPQQNYISPYNQPNKPVIPPNNAGNYQFSQTNKNVMPPQNARNFLLQQPNVAVTPHQNYGVAPKIPTNPTGEHYTYGVNDDIYATPIKVTKPRTPLNEPPDEIPPDYMDDEDLEIGRGQPLLTRSLPAEALRDKLHPNGPHHRPPIGEMPLGRPLHSPGPPKSPQLDASGGRYTPNIQRGGQR